MCCCDEIPSPLVLVLRMMMNPFCECERNFSPLNSLSLHSDFNLSFDVVLRRLLRSSSSHWVSLEDILGFRSLSRFAVNLQTPPRAQSLFLIWWQCEWNFSSIPLQCIFSLVPWILRTCLFSASVFFNSLYQNCSSFSVALGEFIPLHAQSHVGKSESYGRGGRGSRQVQASCPIRW